MASYPDILVTSNDSPSRVLVAIEARLDGQRSQNAIQQLRHYLIQMSCPVGLVILPDELYLFRNKYTGAADTDVEQVGQYRLGGTFDAFRRVSETRRPEDRGRFFEHYVQGWLERLPKGREIDRLSPDLRVALQTHVVPALESGVVRAAGPRELWSNS